MLHFHFFGDHLVKNQVEDSNDFNSSSIYARYKHVRLKLSEETNELIIILYYVHYYPPLALGSAFLVEEKVLHYPPLALGFVFLVEESFFTIPFLHWGLFFLLKKSFKFKKYTRV